MKTCCRLIIRIFYSVAFILCFIDISYSASEINSIELQVKDYAGVRGLRPVTGGVPLPEGAVDDLVILNLFDEKDESIPFQASILARWRDGSVRWVLLDFLSDPPPHGSKQLKLSWNEQAKSTAPPNPVKITDEEGISIRSGDVSIVQTDDCLIRISNRLDVQLTAKDENEIVYNASVDRIEIENDGSVRSTLKLSGDFVNSNGGRLFSFGMRVSIFAGLNKVYLEPLIVVDPEQGIIQKISELNLEFVPLHSMNSVKVGGLPERKEPPGSSVRLFQIDDENYRLEGVSGKGTKAPGWIQYTDRSGEIALAMRDFWQQWPKSIEINENRLMFGLFPRFKAGAFDHMEPWYKYDYLFEGNTFRLRTGQARRWQVWLDLSGDGAALAKHANAPLTLSVNPTQAIATRVWGNIAAADSPGMEEYDQWAENLFDNGYCRSIKEQRDYGAMNWGDWFGERQCNWGNHEYDTPKHILTQFARTGEPKYFYVGDTAARHTSEVDVVHFVNDDLRNYFQESPEYPARPGLVHQHMVGHVGGFHRMEKMRKLYVSLGIGNPDNPYICWSPFNLGHVWTQGMVYQYFLTGDPWVKDTILKIGENLVQLVEDRKYKFKGHSHCGRVNGWTMLAIAGAYELDMTNDRYLRAMKLLADDALSEQDPNCGGWLYKLPWGHCNCETKHVGEAGFIGSIRINGLRKYYELTGDERIPTTIQRGITHLNNDTWQEQYSGWRYTSCPASASGPGRQTGVTIMALVNSVKITGDQEHLRILKKAWDAKFKRLKVAPTSRPGLGKTYSTIMYGCPEAMNLFVNGLD